MHIPKCLSGAPPPPGVTTEPRMRRTALGEAFRKSSRQHVIANIFKHASLLLLCFHKYMPDVSLKEVSQLQEEAAIHFVLIVQLERVFWNGEHMQFSMPEERLLKEMREWRQKRVTDMHFVSKVLVSLAFSQVAVEESAAAGRQSEALKAEPLVLSSPWGEMQLEESGCHPRQQVTATPGHTGGREPVSDPDHAYIYSQPVHRASPTADTGTTHPNQPGCASSRVPP